jgi:hypothetical protein
MVSIHHRGVRALATWITGLVAALGCGVYAAGAVGASPSNPFGVVEVTVAQGVWKGTAWTLNAGDKRTGQQFAACVTVVLAHEPAGGGSCGLGALPEPHPHAAAPLDFPYGVIPAWSSACARHGFGVLMGEVTIRVRVLTIAFSTGRAVETHPYPPPAGLLPTVGFFATSVPCGAHVTGIVGRDANGKIVARFTSPFLHIP